MDDRNQKLVTAATNVFTRYGVSKTTMNDIAREAGVARQTLYNAYPSKEAILRAAVRAAGERSYQAVVTAWAKESVLSDKLDIFFAHGPIAWYDAVRTSPEAADLVDGMHSIAGDEVAQMHRKWTALFTKLIAEIAPEKTDPAATADFFFAASTNAKYDAPDRATFLSRLAVLKQAFLALIQS